MDSVELGARIAVEPAVEVIARIVKIAPKNGEALLTTR
jgi:hypothetical protein